MDVPKNVQYHGILKLNFGAMNVSVSKIKDSLILETCKIDQFRSDFLKFEQPLRLLKFSLYDFNDFDDEQAHLEIPTRD